MARTSNSAGRRNRAVIGRVVSDSGGFAGDWMAAGAGKVVVPLPARRGVSPRPPLGPWPGPGWWMPPGCGWRRSAWGGLTNASSVFTHR